MKKSKTLDDLLSILTENMSDEDILAIDISSKLSGAIARRRIDLGLSQSELASKLGKSQSTISKWENGDMNFTVESLAEIAVKLGMELTVDLKLKEPLQIHDSWRSVSSRVIEFPKERYLSGSSRRLESYQVKEM